MYSLQKPLVLETPALVLETPEHWVEGQRSILHNGEARRKGRAAQMSGRAEKHRGGALPQAKAEPLTPWLGLGRAESVTTWALER